MKFKKIKKYIVTYNPEVFTHLIFLRAKYLPESLFTNIYNFILPHN
jgi:hypothetical protein